MADTLGSLTKRLSGITGSVPVRMAALPGGCVGEVYLVTFPNQDRYVVKVDDSPNPILSIEAYMLTYLGTETRLPVPGVVYADADLLIMEYMPGRSVFTEEAEVHAADLLADLHQHTAPSYGLSEDTLIGGLHQPNRPGSSWLDFFREQRLLHMAEEALRAGRLSRENRYRIEELSLHLQNWLREPDQPSLIHGDIWTSNVLAQHGKVTAFLDPAIYFADPEMELAFITLFDTFGTTFFRRYQTRRPISEGFWETRRHLYNLYPLLVHVRLFGGAYQRSVERTLAMFGF